MANLAASSPADAVAQLAALADMLPSFGDPRALDDLAHVMPDAVATLEPEVCLAMQGVAMALVPMAIAAAALGRRDGCSRSSSRGTLRLASPRSRSSARLP